MLSLIIAIGYSVFLILFNTLVPFLSNYELVGIDSNLTSFLHKVWTFLEFEKYYEVNKIVEVCCLNNSVLHDIFFVSVLLFLLFSIYGFIMSKEKILFLIQNPYIKLIKSNTFLRGEVKKRYLNIHQLEYNLFFTNRYTYDITIITTLIYIGITLIHISGYQSKIELPLIILIIVIILLYGLITKFVLRPILGKSYAIDFFAKKLIIRNFKSLYNLQKYNHISEIEVHLRNRISSFPELTKSDIKYLIEK